jgi:NAD(P)-dependent dehydrogenase (short-subunit alcohol dehydrogenase family)
VQFNGRVAVVTGAETDVGQGFARALASQGMSLMVIAQPGHQVRDFAEELERTHGIRCFPAAADVTDSDAVDRLVMHAEQHVGTIDMVVNTVPGCVTEALIPTMRQRGHGYIVDVSAVE